MKKRSLLTGLLAGLLAAAALAAVCWVVYHYRDSIRRRLEAALEKGRGLLSCCCGDRCDFEDL
ncbi:MAG: hypothetical protein IKP17_07560 [Oscillospiraceae bacterium]|jgi:hypothetical protein|nr:hypothetical protein [Oscillospiraceae bacterium]